jgi:hypothetical protein
LSDDELPGYLDTWEMGKYKDDHGDRIACNNCGKVMLVDKLKRVDPHGGLYVLCPFCITKKHLHF